MPTRIRTTASGSTTSAFAPTPEIERSGLIRWEWTPISAAVFLGLDVKDKPFWTQGHTFHVYNDDGKIVRESSWWDSAQVLRSLGLTAEKTVTPTRSAVGV